MQFSSPGPSETDPPPRYTAVNVDQEPEQTPLLYSRSQYSARSVVNVVQVRAQLPHSHYGACPPQLRSNHSAQSPEDSIGTNKQRPSQWSKFLLIFLIGLILGHVSIRVHWKLQHAAHAKWIREVEKIRRDWETEKQQHERDAKLEEERRKRAGLTWGPVNHGHCIRYQTRYYSAQLLNLVEGLDPVKECRLLGLEINGKVVTPNQCDKAGMNEVWGNWYIDYEEASCGTWWSPPKDMGCTAEGSGYRRYEAHLENVQPGDSWERMCESTPIHFNKRAFSSPDICVNRLFGMYGIWDIPDGECR